MYIHLRLKAISATFTVSYSNSIFQTSVVYLWPWTTLLRKGIDFLCNLWSCC